MVTGDGGFHLSNENGPRMEAHFHFRLREDSLVDEEAYQLLALLGRRVCPYLLDEAQSLMTGNATRPPN